MKKKRATKAKRLVIDNGDAERLVLRDRFAEAALNGLLSNPAFRSSWSDRAAEGGRLPTIDMWHEAVAIGAYEYADAMLAARGKS